jgi:hypothetical protein
MSTGLILTLMLVVVAFVGFTATYLYFKDEK